MKKALNMKKKALKRGKKYMFLCFQFEKKLRFNLILYCKFLYFDTVLYKDFFPIFYNFFDFFAVELKKAPFLLSFELLNQYPFYYYSVTKCKATITYAF